MKEIVMRKWKPMIIMVLCCIMGIMNCGISEVHAETYGDYKYTVLDDGTVKIIGYNGSDTQIKIPGVIGGKSVTSIGNTAFWNCSSLKSIKIPSSVTSIEDSAFAFCSRLNSIKVDAKNGKYDSRNNCNAIIEKSTGKLLVGCQKTIIPSDVTSIGDCAFWGSSLKSIKIPSGVTSIGGYSFAGCKFTTVTIGKNVSVIGDNAFAGCDKLKSVVIKSTKLKKIGSAAFADCPKLKSVVIKSTKLEKIGFEAFCRDKKLTKITLKSTKLTKKSVGRDALEETNKKLVIKVPKKKVSAYKKYFKGKGNKTVKVKK